MGDYSVRGDFKRKDFRVLENENIRYELLSFQSWPNFLFTCDVGQVIPLETSVSLRFQNYKNK